MSIGVVGAILRSLYNRRAPVIPDLKLVWLVLAGFLLQFLILFIPNLNEQFAMGITAFLLSSSFCLLIIFAWANQNEAGFWLLGIGIFFNLLVIVANGGFMPIAPETISQLGLSQEYIDKFVSVGHRFPHSKDIVLLQADTWFWWLSDIFILPASWLWWRPVGMAFSIGDVLIALGAIRFFWVSGAGEQVEQPTSGSFGAIT